MYLFWSQVGVDTIKHFNTKLASLDTVLPKAAIFIFILFMSNIFYLFRFAMHSICFCASHVLFIAFYFFFFFFEEINSNYIKYIIYKCSSESLIFFFFVIVIIIYKFNKFYYFYNEIKC